MLVSYTVLTCIKVFILLICEIYYKIHIDCIILCLLLLSLLLLLLLLWFIFVLYKPSFLSNLLIALLNRVSLIIINNIIAFVDHAYSKKQTELTVKLNYLKIFKISNIFKAVSVTFFHNNTLLITNIPIDITIKEL